MDYVNRIILTACQSLKLTIQDPSETINQLIERPNGIFRCSIISKCNGFHTYNKKLYQSRFVLSLYFDVDMLLSPFYCLTKVTQTNIIKQAKTEKGKLHQVLNESKSCFTYSQTQVAQSKIFIREKKKRTHREQPSGNRKCYL